MQKCIFPIKTGPLLLDLLVKGFQLWGPGNKSKDIWKKEIIKDTIEDGVCSGENKENEGKKKPRKKDFKDSGINYWGDFINPWTPGYDSYKPWIY